MMSIEIEYIADESVHSEPPYTKIYNELIESSLSPRTFRMLTYMLSKPKGYKFHDYKLQEICQCGRDSLQGMRKEAREAGYMRLEKIPSGKGDGRFIGSRYIFARRPIYKASSENLVYRESVSPAAGGTGSQVSNTERLNKTKRIIYKDLKENIKRKDDTIITKSSKPLPSVAVYSSKDNKDDFEKFYSEYPIKKSKAAAAKAFAGAIKKTNLEVLLTALREQKKAREEALKGGGRIFIPHWKHPSTWLNQECWLDEVTYETTPTQSTTKQQKFDEGMDVFDTMKKTLEERRRRAGIISQSPELTYNVGTV
jgi:uncharacterized protein (DUF1697 family)